MKDVPLDPSLRLRVGEIIRQRYRILGELGSGGYATVYRAAQLNLGDREVALKVLAPRGRQAQDMPVAVERFLREARAAASIEHPNVVAIYDVDFLEDGRPYIVMQRVNGHSLSNELDEFGPLHPARALPRFCRTLAALARAHEMGIVHRDIKPANILLTHPGLEEEELKLIDFGVAHLQEEDHRSLTQVHARVGTARYLAPEYVRFGVVTPALDVYQMGLVLVEALTGDPAVGGENTEELLRQAQRGAIVIPPRLMASPLGEVLRHALAVEPADRYPDAATLRRALRKVDPDAVPSFLEGAHTRRRPSDSISRGKSGILLVDTGTHEIADPPPRPVVIPAPSPASPVASAPHGVASPPPHGVASPPPPRVASPPPPRVASAPLPRAASASTPPELVPTQIARPRPAGRPRTLGSTEHRVGPLLATTSVIVAGLAALALGVAVIAWIAHEAEEPAVDPAASAASQVAEPVIVRLTALPAAAEVLADGTALGRGTAHIVFPAGDHAPRRFVVRAPGYTETGVLVDPAGPKQLTVRLQPVRADSPPVVTPEIVVEAPPAEDKGPSRPIRSRKLTPKPDDGKTERPKRFRILE